MNSETRKFIAFMAIVVAAVIVLGYSESREKAISKALSELDSAAYSLALDRMSAADGLPTAVADYSRSLVKLDAAMKLAESSGASGEKIRQVQDAGTCRGTEQGYELRRIRYGYPDPVPGHSGLPAKADLLKYSNIWDESKSPFVKKPAVK